MKTRLMVLLAVLVPAALAQLSSSAPSTTPLRDLAEARIFAIAPVGYAGTTSQEERLFKAMMALDREKAKQQLDLLYSSRNPQAMSYALVGMRKLNPARYAELLAAARASNVTVTTMSGCLIEGRKLRAVANDLDAGKLDPWLRWMRSL
jgi:hypothetical protein